MNVCFIACDNGLGHVRRVVSVANELVALGSTVRLLARVEQANRFGWRVDDFQTRTSKDALRRGDSGTCLWHERLPDISTYDVVVSDNLPEVLLIREDAVLMGSFLWHLVLDDISRQYLQRARKLFVEYRPPMLGTGIFASPELKAITRFEDVGLFSSGEYPSEDKRDLLLSCGASGECERQTADAVTSVMKRGPGPFEIVHVEPRLLPDSSPSWMKAADFSPGMYARVAAAVVRPGVGTLTEVIQAGCTVFCFYERGNREMSYNASQIRKLKLGFDCAEPDAALDAAFAHAEHFRFCSSKLEELPLDGARRAARYLLSHAGH